MTHKNLICMIGMTISINIICTKYWVFNNNTLKWSIEIQGTFCWSQLCGLHCLKYLNYRSLVEQISTKSLFILTYWGRDKNGRHFSDDIFKRVFSSEIVWISISISLKFVPESNAETTGPQRYLNEPVAYARLFRYTIIGSDKGLAPARRQAIFWTNYV